MLARQVACVASGIEFVRGVRAGDGKFGPQLVPRRRRRRYRGVQTGLADRLDQQYRPGRRDRLAVTRRTLIQIFLRGQSVKRRITKIGTIGIPAIAIAALGVTYAGATANASRSVAAAASAAAGDVYKATAVHSIGRTDTQVVALVLRPRILLPTAG